MPGLEIMSGLVQRVHPQIQTGLTKNDGDGTESAIVDLQDSLKDSASPLAIPDAPTTEAPYDGLVCFGTFKIDEDLSG